MENLNEPGWKMKSLSIYFNEYGDYSGKYTGKVQFENRQNEAFVFNLSPQRCEEYLRLIKDELVGAASSLSERLLQSLNMLPEAPGKKLIGETIPHEEIAI